MQQAPLDSSRSDRPVSQRVELVPMGVPVLTSLLAGDLRRAGRLGGFTIPEGIVLRRDAVARRIRQLEEAPQLLPWLLHAIVIRESRTMCGRIGFHSAPGPPELAEIAPDGVEMGYEVDPRYRRRGYAREAVVALMRWAFERHGQKSFVLSISPENTASLAMAASLGFRECGSQLDEVDGLEIIFLRRLDHWPAEWDLLPGGRKGRDTTMDENASPEFTMRELLHEDARPLSQAFDRIGWNKPVEQFERYAEESAAGSRRVIVALVGEEIAGYLTVKWESDYPPFKRARIPEIVDLNVLPDFRRRGIASALMEAAESAIADRSPVAGIGVGLYADYGPAQRMYVLRGYIPDGRGVCYDREPVTPGGATRVDDELVLYFTKRLDRSA